MPEPQKPNRLNILLIICGILGGLGSFVGGVMAVMSWFFPTSFEHRPHLDFLSHPVTFPTWQIILMMTGTVTIAIAAYFIGARRSQSKPPATKSEIVRKPSITNSLPAPPKFVLPLETDDLIIPTDWQCDVQIKIDESFVRLRLANNRLDAIQDMDVIVYSAYSFNADQGQFRTHTAASGARARMPNVVPPSESSPFVVLVHRRDGQPQLFLGNNDARPMKWPENDKTTVQRWKLIVSVGARVHTRTIPPNGTVFQPTKFDLIVDWETETNKLSAHQA